MLAKSLSSEETVVIALTLVSINMAGLGGGRGGGVGSSERMLNFDRKAKVNPWTAVSALLGLISMAQPLGTERPKGRALGTIRCRGGSKTPLKATAPRHTSGSC